MDRILFLGLKLNILVDMGRYQVNISVLNQISLIFKEKK